MTRYHGPFRWMSNFKAVAIDYEYYLTLSDKPQSVCLTERQMYVLSVQNTYTAWLTRWYNTDDITQKTVQFIAAEIEELLMCGCGVPEPSFTDRINSMSYITTTSTVYQDTYNTWISGGQTVLSIAPNLDFATGNPVDISKISCLAWSMLLTSIIEAAKAEKENSSGGDILKQLTGVFGALATAGTAATAVGGGAAALVGFIGGPWLLLGLALAAVGTGIGSLILSLPDSTLNNQAAIDNVYCVLSSNTEGMTLERSVFQGALTPNSFVSGSDEAKLAVVVQKYLDDLDTYLQFITRINGLYDVVTFSLLPECACGDWCYTIDLTLASATTEGISLQLPSPWGEYTSQLIVGTGVRGNNPSQLDLNIIQLTLPTAVRLDTVTMNYDITTVNLVGPLSFIGFDGDFGTGQAIVASGPGSRITSAPQTPVNVVWFGFDRAGLNRDAIGDLKSITVRGSLSNPYSTSNC